MFHEVTPLLSLPFPLGTIEAWADREKPIVIRNGETITPLSIEQAQEVMRALGGAVKMLPLRTTTISDYPSAVRFLKGLST